MAKSIETQITEMRQELDQHKKFKKNVQKRLKKLMELMDDIPVKEVGKVVKKTVENPTEFERKICEFYSLETEEQKQEYLRVMLNPTSGGYWANHRKVKVATIPAEPDQEYLASPWE